MAKKTKKPQPKKVQRPLYQKAVGRGSAGPTLSRLGSHDPIARTVMQ